MRFSHISILAKWHISDAHACAKEFLGGFKCHLHEDDARHNDGTEDHMVLHHVVDIHAHLHFENTITFMYTKHTVHGESLAPIDILKIPISLMLKIPLSSVLTIPTGTDFCPSNDVWQDEIWTEVTELTFTLSRYSQ